MKKIILLKCFFIIFVLTAPVFAEVDGEIICKQYRKSKIFFSDDKYIAEWIFCDEQELPIYSGEEINGLVTVFIDYGVNKGDYARLYYANNKRQDGEYEWFYSDGNTHFVETSRDGYVCGLRTEYDDKGNLKSGSNYIKGLIDGEAKKYYENGNIMEMTNFKSGKEDGLRIKYYLSGAVYEKCEFKDGLKNGFYELFGNDTGALVVKGKFVQGKAYGDFKVIDGNQGEQNMPYEDAIKYFEAISQPSFSIEVEL